MSAAPRRASPGDVGGRTALGVAATLLIYLALSRADWTSLPLLVAGVLLLILFAFYSRIAGQVGVWNVRIPIAPDSHRTESSRRQDPRESELEAARRREHSRKRRERAKKRRPGG